MTTQRPLRFSRGCWSLSISSLQSESVLLPQLSKIGVKRTIELKLSVPKRVLKQAVRRNQAKRVARESWLVFQSNDFTRQLGSKSLLLRLSRRPFQVESNGQTLVGQTTDSKKGLDLTSARSAKAMMRADCDALFVQLARYLESRSNV
jgi:RNase P protein component